ncbi:MAG: hypothetical protein PW792_17400 [Acidobacteriaceae bacterium]|nr:hypothetical protein [Acidobacteriaceae bacterium]
MKTLLRTSLAAAALFATAPLFAQTSDFPGASDFPEIQRPTNAIAIGAMRIDMDEFVIPTGPVERSGSPRAGKSVTAQGSIDYLAYSGSTTTSSLATYTGLATQVRAHGFKEIYSCARTTCGSAFTLDELLGQPVIASIHTGNWGHYMINSLNATNDDSRYGVFQKEGVYFLLLASLSPGEHAGALIIRIANPPQPPILQSAAAAGPVGDSPAQPATNAAGQSLRSKARGWLSHVQ